MSDDPKLDGELTEQVVEEEAERTSSIEDVSPLDWDCRGLLSPVKGADSEDRSPHLIPIDAFIQRFGFSEHRMDLIENLLAYRAMFYQAGITEGFQWINGSFVEHKEIRKSEPPNDIDVVTFFRPPAGLTEAQVLRAAPDIFNRGKLKADYSLDAYSFPLGGPTSHRAIHNHAYWYSVWSHTRDGEWKGFIELEFSHDEDIIALQRLSN